MSFIVKMFCFMAVVFLVSVNVNAVSEGMEISALDSLSEVLTAHQSSCPAGYFLISGFCLRAFACPEGSKRFYRRENNKWYCSGGSAKSYSPSFRLARCPAGYRNTGSICLRPQQGSIPPSFFTDRFSCPAYTEKYFAKCFDKCRSKYVFVSGTCLQEVCFRSRESRYNLRVGSKVYVVCGFKA